jgi:hypothetical protein
LLLLSLIICDLCLVLHPCCACLMSYP